MHFVLDFILLVILALSAFAGWKKGALASLISLAGGIAAIALALFLTAPISTFVAETFVEPAIQAPVSEAIGAYAEEHGGISSLLHSPPEALIKLFETLGVDTVPFFQDNSTTAATLAGAIAKPLAKTVSYAATFLVLFIVLSVAVKILISLAKKFNGVPVLGKANRAVGLVLGLVKGLIFAWAFATLFHTALPYLATANGSAETFAAFEESKTLLYTHLYRINPITLITEQVLALKAN